MSIIIVNWNTKDCLLRCLESVFQSAGKGSWEVMVVDNGSRDGSVSEVKKAFPSVHLIQNEKNVGFAGAVNQGLQKASGRYVLLLNPDTQVNNGAIERLMSFMDAHPKAGISGAQLLKSDGSKQNSIANFPSLATELLNKNLLRWLFPEKFPGKGSDYSEPIEVDSVIGACMMVRRDAIEQVGLLDEDYFLFLEETDWCYRMKRAGWKIYHVPDAEVYHLQGKSAEAAKGKARIEYYRSRYHYFSKNKGRLQQVLLMIGLMVRLWIELIFMFMACTLTFFKIEKWRRKLSTYARLAWWHLRLCPDGMGLKNESTKLQAPNHK